tara:strand:- start:3544 stop:3777 length:234 start_codon:yes stop_codon:yes gene_type:complete
MKRVRTPEEFKKAREALKMTQTELAEALRVPEPVTNGRITIARYEKGSNARGISGPTQVAMEALLTGWRPTGYKGEK